MPKDSCVTTIGNQEQIDESLHADFYRYPWGVHLLKYGQPFKVRKKQFSFRREYPLGRCYGNSIVASIAFAERCKKLGVKEQRIRYAEGIARHPTAGDILHAWCVFTDGVVDVTWPKEAPYTTYFGIAFDPEWALQATCAHGYEGILQHWDAHRERVLQYLTTQGR